ncbi:MAG: tRNA (adenosine(37)-N6)-threonylcarbamoyltransferase complex dimerization subunit type 1 TsaB [Bacilli bacterium]
MINFFIDSATSLATLALLKDEKIIEKIVITSSNDLSTTIFEFIEKLFFKNNIVPADIDCIYISIGPGSFTGIRIGVTIAKTFAWARKIKIITLSSLEIMATTSSNSKYNIPIIDARRGYVYAGIYDNNMNNIMEDQYIKLDDLVKKNNNKDTIFITNDNLIDGSILPDINIEKIVLKHQFDQSLNPHMVNPNYLKITEAEANINND